MNGSSRSFWYRDVPYPTVRTVRNQAEAVAEVAAGTIVIISPQGSPKSIKMLCPCGCGELLTIQLVRASGKSWSLVRGTRGEVSLYPSVWRDFGCESHFLLRNNIARLLYGNIPKMTAEEEERWWNAP